MNYLHLYSWYYDGAAGESKAREFFEILEGSTEQGIRFPFDCPHQVGLVHCTVDEHWCIGVLVLRPTQGDDSMEQSTKLKKWFGQCGANLSGADEDCSPTTLPSVEQTLQSRFGKHYTCVDSFETMGLSLTGNRVAAQSARPAKNGVSIRRGLNDVLQLAGISALALIPQLLGVWIATGAINDPRTPVGGKVFFGAMGLALVLGPTLAVLFAGIPGGPSSRLDRVLWLIVEVCKLALVAVLIMVFDIDALKLLWSTPE